MTAFDVYGGFDYSDGLDCLRVRDDFAPVRALMEVMFMNVFMILVVLTILVV